MENTKNYSNAGQTQENKRVRTSNSLVGNPLSVSGGSALIGYARFMLGERNQGLKTLQKGIEVGEAVGFVTSHPINCGLLAFCYSQVGMMKEAMDMANKSLKSTSGAMGYEIFAYNALAIARAQENPSDSQQVDQTMEKGLRLCEERGQRPWLSWGYYHYAQILFDRGDHKKSQEYLNQAIELFTEMQMPWWLDQAQALEERLG